MKKILNKTLNWINFVLINSKTLKTVIKAFQFFSHFSKYFRIIDDFLKKVLICQSLLKQQKFRDIVSAASEISFHISKNDV